MKNLKLITLIILLTSFFQSCQKEIDMENEIKSFKNPYENVGIEHNVTVKNILNSLSDVSQDQKINFTNSYLSNQILNIGKQNKSSSDLINYNLMIEDYSVYKNGKNLYQAFSNYTKMNKNKSNQIFIDQKDVVKIEVDNVLDFLESENLKLVEILNEIERRELLVEEKFDEEHFETIYSFYSTIKNSCKLWAPINEGGEGLLDVFTKTYSKSNFSKSSGWDNVKWWKVGACDAVGALVGCRGGVWGAVITGAGASVISVIMQW